jgi:hypothetical protein
MPTKLAQLIAHNEGFGVAGAAPTRKNNPGDLRHSPHSSHTGEGADDIGIIDTVEHGWEDLERQLQIYAGRAISVDPATGRPCAPRLMTLSDLAYTYAPPADNNPTPAYLASLCNGLGVDESTTVADALAMG